MAPPESAAHVEGSATRRPVEAANAGLGQPAIAARRSFGDGRARLSPRDLWLLQRTIGNSATCSLLTKASSSPNVIRRYGANKKQSAELKRKIADRWGRAIEKEGSELDDAFVTDVTDWCASHSQAQEVVETLTYEEWDQLRFKMSGAEAQAAGSPRDAFQSVAVTKKKAVADPHAMAKTKIKGLSLDVAKFSEKDLEVIGAGKAAMGWEGAIQAVWTQITNREETARLEAERAAKYAAAKTAGDAVFAAGLVKQVWLVAWSVAVSGNAGANCTVAGTYPDAEILAAVTLWRARHAVTLGQAPGTVTNFHVPGGVDAIQDKSTRAVNPDPTRGRQADFISDWGSTAINVHVDSDRAH